MRACDGIARARAHTQYFERFFRRRQCTNPTSRPDQSLLFVDVNARTPPPDPSEGYFSSTSTHEHHLLILPKLTFSRRQRTNTTSIPFRSLLVCDVNARTSPPYPSEVYFCATSTREPYLQTLLKLTFLRHHRTNLISRPFRS